MADANPDIPVDPYSLIPLLAHHIREYGPVSITFHDGTFAATSTWLGQWAWGVDRELGRALDQMLELTDG